jgi:phospholipid transport system transporter-binding protein
MKLPATITMESAAAVHASVQAAMQQGSGAQAVAFDASELKAFDTSALAVLLAAQRSAQAKGQSVLIQQAPAKLNQLAALYGVSELLGLQTGGI